MASGWWTAGWIWAATGWTLCALGVVLLVWALFWDRSRGRKRCPKCWYDMGGAVAANAVGPWVCAECGRSMKAASDLCRTRRLWRLGGVSAVVWIASYACFAIPRVVVAGWAGWIPTTALVACLPWLERPAAEKQQEWIAGKRIPVLEHLFMDLRRNRYDKDSLHSWQKWLMWEIILAGDPDSPEWRDRLETRYGGYLGLARDGKELTLGQYRRLWDTYSTEFFSGRKQWPAGISVVQTVNAWGWWGSTSNGRYFRISPTKPGAPPIEVPVTGPGWWDDATKRAAWNRHNVELGVHQRGEAVEVRVALAEVSQEDWSIGRRTGTELWSRTLRLSVEVVDRKLIEQTPVAVPEVSDMLARGELKTTAGMRYSSESLRPGLMFPDGDLRIMPFLGASERELLVDLVFAIRIELFRDGERVASGSSWRWQSRTAANVYQTEGHHGWGIPLIWTDDAFKLQRPFGHEWVVQIVSDRELALRCTQTLRYWEGSVTAPVVIWMQDKSRADAPWSVVHDEATAKSFEGPLAAPSRLDPDSDGGSR